MKELLRTNETVFLSWLEAMLASEDIRFAVLDKHMSVLEGSANAIPRRVMVDEEDYERARRILVDTGEGWRLG